MVPAGQTAGFFYRYNPLSTGKTTRQFTIHVSFATLADILMIMDMDAFGSFRREGERVIATTKTIAVNSRNNPKKAVATENTE